MMDSSVIAAVAIASVPNLVAVVWFAATTKATQREHTAAIKSTSEALRILTALYNEVHSRVMVLEDRSGRRSSDHGQRP